MNSQNTSTSSVPSTTRTGQALEKYKPKPTSVRERIAAKLAKTKGVGARARSVMSSR